MISNLIRNLYLGPALIVAGVVFLYFIIGDTSQIIAVASFAIACGLYGIVFRNRWIIALASLFLYYFISFELQTVFSGVHSAAVVCIFLSSFLIFLWYCDEIYSIRNIVIAFTISIAILECFLALLFWPINLISRSMILVILTFLVFEAADKSVRVSDNFLLAQPKNLVRTSPWIKMRSEILGATVIIGGIILSSHWFIF